MRVHTLSTAFASRQAMTAAPDGASPSFEPCPWHPALLVSRDIRCPACAQDARRAAYMGARMVMVRPFSRRPVERSTADYEAIDRTAELGAARADPRQLVLL